MTPPTITPEGHAIYIVFLFALGSCVGSFLNVVVWRLPRVEPAPGDNIFRAFYRSLAALSSPPSHCPKCNHLLKWYDNLPVIGWIKLGGKCRFCKAPISMRYPIVEAITGLLFVGYYVAFHIFGVGPTGGLDAEGQIIQLPLNWFEDWPIYFLDMILISALLAASLIDAELFIIPIEIPWVAACIGIAGHTIFDTPELPGNVMTTPLPGALAAGSVIGLIVSNILLAKGIFPRAFADGTPMLEVEREANAKEREAIAKAQAGKESKGSGHDVQREEEPELREWSPSEIRAEIRKEMLFLLPVLLLGMICLLLAWKLPAIGRLWADLVGQRWLSALLGSLLGALVGGFVVWAVRIVGSYCFGREAMGMGDVDLMVGVGAVLGAGPATTAFFVAPFFGIAFAITMLFTGKKRELPYGPFLSLASAAVILFYGPIISQIQPQNLVWLVKRLVVG